MAEILIDTDVVIDHLRGARGFLPTEDRAAYSVITRVELFSGKFVDEAGVTELLEPLREIAVDRRIAERAGRLRRNSRMRTPDALIASTAMEHGLTLVSRNAKDYAGIKGLEIRSPR